MQPRGAQVVTPEAVVLDVQTAGLGSRIFARIIDLLVQGAILIVLLLLALAVGSTGGLVIFLAGSFLVLVWYPIVLETVWRGKTLGKAALGLRVVTKQGAPIRFRHAVVRGFIGLLEVMTLPVIGVLAMLLSSKDQRLGDMAAGTIVIRERAAAAATPASSLPAIFYPPPGTEPYVGTLDVSAMTAGEYETVRLFLLRARDLDPGSRTRLAMRIATPLVARWHQPVPDGMWPEVWLACAVAAYQQRFGFPSAPYGGWGAPAPGVGPPRYWPPPSGPPSQPDYLSPPPPPPGQPAHLPPLATPPPPPVATPARAPSTSAGSGFVPPE
ncbi:MAG: RDD family protein [Acidimicrobiales bacterium]